MISEYVFQKDEGKKHKQNTLLTFSILGIGFDTPYFKYNSWRIFLLMCAFPSFVVTGLLFYLPESPRFLIMQGRRDKALNILRNIFVTNTGQTKEVPASLFVYLQ